MRMTIKNFKSAKNNDLGAISLVTLLMVSVLFFVSTYSRSFAQALESNKKEVLLAQAGGAKAQERINKIDDETAKLESEYKAVLQQLETLRIYNNQLRELIDAQKAEMIIVQRDIDRVTTIDREVVPLMLKMVDGIDQFVELDVPFLIEERRARVSNLKALMQRADASPAEKFRKVLEAYQIENEYGRTIEGIRGNVSTSDGRQLTVDFLRLGRVALFYKTLDDSEIARWNSKTKSWEDIDSSFVSPIKQALSIAREQAAPDLLLLPLDAPENVQ